MTKGFLQSVSDLFQKAEVAFATIVSLEDVSIFQNTYLGKGSQISEISKKMKGFSEEEKRTIGPEVKRFHDHFSEQVNAKCTDLKEALLNEKLKKDWIDVTKNSPLNQGALHPISQVQREVEDIFISMGFEIADGPELETEWHNFDALNIPSTHPARDMQDTFWVKSDSQDPNENRVLRTQTSNVQIRKMRETGAPVRIIAPGRVFRSEAVDASHDAMFYQVEGLVVDEGISLAHLKGAMEAFLTELFEKEEKVRLRPGYFPFVEPGLEVDFSCTLCEGEGCKTCKHTGWIEFMGAGMVHPEVLKNCNIDPGRYSGFAFGFGLTRLVMMKYGIDDIRLLSSQKVDFISQF